MYDEAARLLGSLEEIGRTHNTLPGKNMSYYRGLWGIELAFVLRAQGQKDKARAGFETSKKDFAAWLAQRPQEPKALGYVAICDAGLGNKEEALREGRKAQEVSPRSRGDLVAPSRKTDGACLCVDRRSSDRISSTP